MKNGQFCYITSLLVLFPSSIQLSYLAPCLSLSNSNHSSVVTYFASVRQEMRLKGEKNTISIACPLWISEIDKVELKGLYKFVFNLINK